jgi:Bacterial Ig-like domain (group 3)
MTLSFSPRRWVKQCVSMLNRSLAALPKKRRRMSVPLTLEYLEDRCVPTSVAPGTFSGTITANTEFDQAGTYTITGPLTVASGATLTVGKVGQSVNLVINAGQTLTDNGTLNIINSVPVSFGYAYGATTKILVGNGGVMSANGIAFTGINLAYNAPTIEVGANGHFTSSNSTFTLTQFSLDAGSILNAGDLVGNTFNTSVSLPPADLPYLSNNKSFHDIDVVSAGTLGSGQTLALNAIGTVTTANLRYVFPTGLTVGAGATLTVAPNVSVLIPSGQTLTDDGTVTFGSGDAVSFGYAYGTTTKILVGNGGVMSAASTNFSAASVSNTTLIEVGANGHFTSSNSTFTLTQFSLDAGSILNTGDLVGNTFNTSLSLPAADVKDLSGSGSDNVSFQDIDILAGSIGSGQTVVLNAIGTAPTGNKLRYVFPSSFTVNAGGVLSFGPNVSVLIQPGQYLTDVLTDDGTVTFGSGDTVSFGYAYAATAQILVGNGGVMSAASTIFSAASVSNTTLIEVGSGGHFTSSNSTFTLTELSLDAGSILNAGDLVGNTFNLPLFLPAADVQDLSGAGSNNLSFQDIDILAGSIGSGQTLALNSIGTATTANLRYVFSGAFTVGAGATLTVAPNVSVLIQPNQTLTNQTLTDDGTVTFSSGDTVSFGSYTGYRTTTKILVGNGGVMSAASTIFSAVFVNDITLIEVGSGGHFTAGNSTFTLTELSLDAGSILNAGDLVGNTFNLPLFIPAIDVQYLYGAANNNLSFHDIDIQPGTLTSGQNVALNAIGTATTANLRYVFLSNFTVGTGASMTVGPNVNVQIARPTTPSSVTLADNGVLSFGANDTVTLNSVYIGGGGGGTQTAQIVVSGGGELKASGTTFAAAGDGQGVSQVVVNSGGQLQASTSTFVLSQLNLNTGSNDTLSTDLVFGPFTINSGATINIANNDFSNIGTNGLIAVGDPSATIHLENNYWGTTISTQIDAKIDDHNDNSALPTVSYAPFLTEHPAQTGAAPAAVSFTTGASNVALSATVNSPGVIVNEGTETFTILQGTTVIGTAVTVSVVNGIANTNYALPADLSGGSYTIKAVYNGDANFLGYTDVSQFLTINAAASTTTAATASAVYNSSTNTVALSAVVASGGGVINEGTETFTILQGTTVIGTAVTVSVVNGAASTSYALPAGLTGGSYTIQAVYNGTVNFQSFTDVSQTLTINAAASTTAASAASATFNSTTDTVALNAAVTSAAGTVNGGTETFTILQGTTVIGTAVMVNVVNGAASGNYVLPAGLAGGSYTIKAVYSGDANFLTFTDVSQTLTINAAVSTTAASAASATFNSTTNTVALSATVTSAAGTVNGGTETFTILNGTTVIGTAVMVNVVSGAASANYTLPAGLSGGSYTIRAVYNGDVNFLAFTDISQTLTINAAVSTTAAAGASTAFSSSAQTVALSATVTSAAGTVNEGTETFTILQGTTVIGTAATVSVVNGAANANYTLPAGTAIAPYTIQAVYNGDANFLTFTDASHFLDVSATSTTAAAAASVTFNATTQTVALSATVTSGGNAVNEGTETFTILQGTTVVGSPITVSVVSGAANANYALPAGLTGGSYTIKAVYNGDANFLAFTDVSQVLTINAAASTTSAAAASTAFNSSAQTVALSATVTSAAGTVNEGRETFTLLKGTTVIGTAVTVSVVNGAANANYSLPAGTAGGPYTIQAVYNGTADFLAFTAASQTLTINAAASTTSAAAAATAFSSSAQTVALSATVTSAAGTVNEGTETFTILQGTTVIGTAVTVSVVNGVANTNYTLPAGTAIAPYTIQAVYNGDANFLAFTDNTHHLTVSAAASATAAATASTTFNSSAQTVALSATVTSAAGTVNEGTETFTILNGTTVIGTAVMVNVVNGAAGGNYTLPASIAGGSYTIQAVYNGTADFLAFTDNTHHLTVNAAASTTTAANATAVYNSAAQTVALSATISSAAGIVNEGAETFTILSGATVVGSPITVSVINGAAHASYTLPAGVSLGSYTIRAVYNGDANYLASTDASHTLTVSAAVRTTAVLKSDGSLWQYTAASGLQLLSPAGTILSVSAIADSAGNADFYAVTADHHLWEHTVAGWAFLSAGSFQQLSAATNAAGKAVVFAVLTDHSLWENSSLFAGDHWRMLSPGGTILSINAVTDAAGNDDVYAVTSDTHLWEHTPVGWAFLSAGSFQQVSAGLNGAGQAIIFGVLTDHSLWENNLAFGGDHWRLLSAAGSILSVSAGGADDVFAITSDNHLWEHTASGWAIRSVGSFASLSGATNAAGQGDVFAVLTDTSFWEYDPAFPGWQDLVPSGVAFGSAARTR